MLLHRTVLHNQVDVIFNFLQPSDPYHAYYQQCVLEIAVALLNDFACCAFEREMCPWAISKYFGD
jgi:hypothetical protein